MGTGRQEVWCGEKGTCWMNEVGTVQGEVGLQEGLRGGGPLRASK